MTLEQIQKAKNNSNELKKLYEKLFYDSGGSPKLRYWLINHGVHYNEVDDVESSMKELFMKGLMEYEDDRIDFEKWMWIKFKQQLSNFFFNKTLKKNADLVFEHNLERDDGEDKNETFYDKIKFDMGNISDVTFDIEENIPNCMNHLQSYIYKCKVYSSYSEREIFELQNLTEDRKEFQNEVNNVRNKIKKYINGEL